MIVTLSSRSTLTLPADVRKGLRLEPGDALDVTVQDGSIMVTPVAVVPRTLALSKTGERKEAEASAQIRAGKTEVFETAEALLEDLNEDR